MSAKAPVTAMLQPWFVDLDMMAVKYTMYVEKNRSIWTRAHLAL